MSAILRASPAAARRFLRRAQLLERPAATVDEALRHLGCVQMDPINVCGRMHDLILRNRVAGYREGALLRHLYGPEGTVLPPDRRTAFEHYATPLVALPLDAWPHLQRTMRHRRRRRGGYGGRLTAAEERLAGRILDQIAAEGPLAPDAIDHAARAVTAWGTRGRTARIVLEKLFFHGRVLITRREGFRRIYDLPERILPPSLLQAPLPEAEDTARWQIVLRLRQRRLGVLRRQELPLVEHAVTHVAVDGCPPLYCLREDAPLLEACADAEDGGAAPLLLAPLDPLIYDRRLTLALWGFDYTWEAYTPAAKRRRGHYALPVLSGLELAGHVEPRIDRAANRLRVQSRSLRRGHRAGPAVRELAAFLGLRGPAGPAPRDLASRDTGRGRQAQNRVSRPTKKRAPSAG